MNTYTYNINGSIQLSGTPKNKCRLCLKKNAIISINGIDYCTACIEDLVQEYNELKLLTTYT